MLIARLAADDEPPAALEVWRSANVARGLAPSPERVRRMEEKLNEPSGLLVVVAESGRLLGMALAEPFRDRDGIGRVIAGAGHISMVFVAAGRWGEGIGGGLIHALHGEMLARDWTTASL